MSANRRDPRHRDRRSRARRPRQRARHGAGQPGAHRRHRAARQRLHRGAGRAGAEARRPGRRASAPRPHEAGRRALRGEEPVRRGRAAPRWPARRSSASRPPAARDAALVRRLEAEGAVLVGALNMDEYAYGFTTENTHYGATRNPHDLARIERRLLGRLGRGGGGRAGAADAGLRHQRLDPRAGLAVRHLRPEAHLRPAAAHRQLPLRGQPGPPGPVRAQRRRPGAGLRRDAGRRPRRPGLRAARRRAGVAAAEPRRRGPARRRARRLVPRDGAPEATAAVDAVAQALGTTRLVELPEVERARAAAFVITCGEGARAAPGRPAPARQGFRPA